MDSPVIVGSLMRCYMVFSAWCVKGCIIIRAKWKCCEESRRIVRRYNVSVYICVCMYVRSIRKYVHMCVCMYVCMCIYVHAYVSGYLCIYMDASIYSII